MRGFLTLGALSLLAVSASAKDKIAVTIQVVSSQASVREFTGALPATAGKSTTSCDTNGDVIGGQVSANTDCTTVTTPGKPAEKIVTHIEQEHVRVVMPNGDHVTLWCQVSWRRCVSLQPGSYEAELKGDVAWIYTHDLAGKIRKTKYLAVGGW
jgi:hypothetical protein